MPPPARPWPVLVLALWLLAASAAAQGRARPAPAPPPAPSAGDPTCGVVFLSGVCLLAASLWPRRRAA